MTCIKMKGDTFDQNVAIENKIIKGEQRVTTIVPVHFGETFLKIFDSKPNHVGQIEAETGKKTTYREMKENSIRLAVWMRNVGIKSNDVIALCTYNRIDTYVPYIATFLTGATINPWFHGIDLKAAKQFMSLTKPKLIFCCATIAEVLSEAKKLEKVDGKIIVLGNHAKFESLENIIHSQAVSEIQKFQAQPIQNTDSIALILYTSGSTGEPKGVAHSYKGLSRYLDFSNIIPESSVCMWYSLICWISGAIFSLNALFSNATRIIHRDFENSEQTCEFVEKYKVDWLFVGPRLLMPFSMVSKQYNMESLQAIVTGGGKCSVEVVKEVQAILPNVFISQIYGMTEAGLISIKTDKCKEMDTVGFVMPNFKLKIIEITSHETLEPDIPGEICLKSPWMMVGYYKNQKATNEVIDSNGWLHSGDLGYYTENGEIVIVDRIKEFIKYREFKYSPFEIEELLLKHPDVIEVAVVPVPHIIDYEQPMAFVRKVPGSKVTEADLIELSSTLEDKKKLRGGVIFLDKLPITATEKINRKVLKEMAKSLAK